MTEPTWTADEAYRILRTSLLRFIASDSNAVNFQQWLLNRYGTPPGTPRSHPANRLFQHVLLHVAVYLQCDLDRSVLTESLQQIVDAFDRGESVGFTPITRSPCFIELLKSGQIPSPLIDLARRNEMKAWEAEGFREI